MTDQADDSPGTPDPTESQNRPEELPEDLRSLVDSSRAKGPVRGAVENILRAALAADLEVTAEQVVENDPSLVSDLSNYLEDRAIHIAENLISQYRSA